MKEGSSKSNNAGGEKSFQEKIDAKQARMLASRMDGSDKWIGFTSLGVIGWMIVVPVLAGIATGLWLDRSFPTNHSWTLMLLAAGLIFGCVSSWRWVEEERKENERDEQFRKESVDRQLAQSDSVKKTTKFELEDDSGL